MNSPTATASSRLFSLDLIRGVAIPGMLFVNLLVFIPDHREIAWNEFLAGYPTIDGLIDKWIFVLFNGKMRALFAMLFGAGILLFFQSVKHRESNSSDHFARRMIWLMLFGLVHVYVLLWPGSILFEYALCGLLLFPFRELPARRLLIASVLVLSGYVYLQSKDYSQTHAKYEKYLEATEAEKRHAPLSDQQQADKAAFLKMLEGHAPYTEATGNEIREQIEKNKATYRSGFGVIYKQNVSVANEALSLGVYLNILESIGTVLLGMFLFKVGFFEFRLHRSVYYLLAFVAFPVGLLLYLQVYHWQTCTQSEMIEIYAWKVWSNFTVESAARVIQALGYAALLLLMTRVSLLKTMLTPLANVGRMAFTNYLFQTSAAVLFFYGMQYYGSFQLSGYAVFGLCLVAIQLIGSTLCIRYVETGPVEYLWRKLSQKAVGPRR